MKSVTPTVLRTKKLNCTVQKYSCVGTLTQRPSDDQATTKRRPISAMSYRPPTADAVVVTELSGGARVSCQQSHHGCAEHCVPRNPRMPSQRVPGRASRRPSWATHNIPTPREQKTHRVQAHKQILILAEREMDAKIKRRRAWILPSARCSRPTNGDHKLNQSEVRRQSALNGPNIQLSP